jgi:hypothetical protein
MGRLGPESGRGFYEYAHSSAVERVFGNVLSLHPSLTNYKMALDQLPFGQLFLNTFGTATGSHWASC